MYRIFGAIVERISLISDIKLAKMTTNTDPSQDLVPPDDNADDVLLWSPSRNTLNPFARYLTTSSAKRRKVKEKDCKFCEGSIDGGDLFNHLKKEKNCRSLYMIYFKVKSFDSLVVKMFSCEMCFERKQIDFKKHLRKNQNCFKKYQKKLGENDLEEIHKKVSALRRAALPSRSAAARTLNYMKQKTKMEEEKMNKTMTSSLNEYRDSIMISNYRLCIVCNSNFGEYGARQVKDEEELFETLQLSSPDQKRLRRFEKFFICNNCNKEPIKGSEETAEKSSTLGEIALEDKIKFFPLKDAVQVAAETVEETDISIMFPTGCEAIKTVQNPQKLRSKAEIVRKVYENGKVERSTIAAIYETEANKYKQVEESGEKYTAVIKDFDKKELSYVEKVRSSFRITGSDGWFEQEAIDMKHRQDQFGSIFITLKLDLPQTSLEVIATCLLQKGIVISIDKIGSAEGELQVVYKLHLDHMSDKDCSEDCVNIVDLKDYIENQSFEYSEIGNKYVGTYVSSIHQKLISFVRCIVEAPASGLFSENYHLMLVFNLAGQASIIGCIWPDALEEINLDLAENDGDMTMTDKFIEFVSQNISSTSDQRVLRSSFKLSEKEAKAVSELVQQHQFHVCDAEVNDCSLCSSADLPSLDTTMKECCSKLNLQAAEKFKERMKKKLEELTSQEKRTLSTWNWLEQAWLKVNGDISEGLEFLTISFHEDEEEVVFEIDERLTNLLEEYGQSPLTAAYQYAITCCAKLGGVEVVLKRLWIADCYTQPFNPFFLKTNSPSVVKIVNNTKMFHSLLFGERRFEREEQIDHQVYFSHKCVSLAEAVSLADKTKKRVKSSTKVEFVNAKPNRKVTLRKVSELSEDNFKLEGSTEQFKMVESNISRHFDRKNGDLILAETVCWYDYIGSDKSKELSMMYAELEVPASDEECVSSNATLPNYILCKNGDVMKKRRKKKIMVFPQPKTQYDKMYSKCLLFLPLKSEGELLEPNMIDKFKEMTNSGLETIVDFNEKKMFKKKIEVKEVKETEAIIDDPIDPLDFLLEALEKETEEPDERD